MNSLSPGARFRKALEENNPLQVVGAINAYCAMLAEDSGHKAIYLSGGGVANASYGLPDLGITSLNDVIHDVERICNASASEARAYRHRQGWCVQSSLATIKSYGARRCCCRAYRGPGFSKALRASPE